MPKHSKKRGVAVQGAWLPVSLDFLRSRACAELSPLSAKLMLDVLSMLGTNASRNGDICLTPKLMALRGWNSRASLSAAVRELTEHGLLFQTRQGSRLDCSLFACTLYPLDCDLRKLDVIPGCFTTSAYMGNGSEANPPTESHPAKWRHPRKSEMVTPLRYKVVKDRSATVQSPTHKKAA